MTKTENNKETKRHVLIALSGKSPAVVTETVWAMACSLETPVVPDEVVVLTTKTGAQKLREALQFDDGKDEPSERGPWGELKKVLAKAGHEVDGKLILTGDTIKEFKGVDRKSLDDLITRQDNLQAANLMMQVIRDYTDDDDCVVHAQLAGGRKTMSALFFSCMCLLGRPCDHIYHILVNEGYDNPKLEPPFLFPKKGVVHKGVGYDRKPISLKSTDCKPNLFDVPFVPMGEWAEQKCKMSKRRRLSYESVIEAVNVEVQNDICPKIVVDCAGKGCILLNGMELEHTASNFLVLLLLLQGVGSEGVKYRIYGFKDVVAAQEDGWPNLQKIVQKSPCRWLYDVLWETKLSGEKGNESESDSIPSVYYYDTVKQNNDAFTKSKSAVKDALRKIHALKLLELFEQRGDGTLKGIFDYAAVEWRNADRVPEFARDYIFPRDVPFPVDVNVSMER